MSESTPRGIKRAALILVSGSGVSMMLAAGTAVLVARFYVPSQVGAYALVLSAATLAAPLASLRIEAAIVPSSTQEDAWGLARIALSASIILSAVILLGLLGYLFVLAGPDHMHGIWLFCPVLTALLSTYSVMTQVALRSRRYGAISSRGILQNSTIGTFQLLLGVRFPYSLSLAFGESIGRLVGVAALLPGVATLRRTCRGRPTPARELWPRYGGAVKHYLPAVLADSGTAAVSVALATYWFGPGAAGVLALTNRVLTAPVALIAASLGAGLLAEVSARRRLGNAGQAAVVRNALRHLAAWSAILGLLQFSLAPSIAGVLVAGEWAEAGELARWLSFATATSMVWNPLSAVFVVYERWRSFLAITMTSLLLLMLAGVSFHAAGAGFVATFAAMASASAVVFAIGVGVVWRMVGSDALEA